MKFFKIPFQSGGDEPLDPRLNKLQQYIQSQSVPDMTRLASEISPEVKQIIGTNVQALLGYLPNQDFNTTIMANKESLQNLLASAMVTGYFMHAMEVRLAMDQAMQVDPTEPLDSPLLSEETSEDLSEKPLEKGAAELLQSPEALFEGLDRVRDEQSNEKVEPTGSAESADKLNIQLEINTQMGRNDLTELLRELHKFQAAKTESKSIQDNDTDHADSESPPVSDARETNDDQSED